MGSLLSKKRFHNTPALKKVPTYRFVLGCLLFIPLLAFQCTGEFEDSGVVLSWKSDPEITGTDGEVSNSLDVDIYLDATTSMVGYMAEENNVYSRFLEELESIIQTGWGSTNVQFHKFGRRVKEVDRSAFRDAITDQRFYRESGIFETTNIDLVVEQSAPSRLSIVITDLFQDEQDINALVERLRNKVFQNGIGLSLLGIPSEFNGTVYDAKVAPYTHASTSGDTNTYRPFYVLMFGRAEDMVHLVETFGSTPYLNSEYFLLFTSSPVQRNGIHIAKNRKSTGINPATPQGEADAAFIVKPGESGGTLEATVVMERKPYTPLVMGSSTKEFELIAERKNLKEESEAIATSDISLNELRRGGDTLYMQMDLNINAQKGTYQYNVLVQTKSVNAFGTPTWVQNFSSNNPSPESGPNLTLNLDRFIESLLRAKSVSETPRLAKMTLDVTKR